MRQATSRLSNMKAPTDMLGVAAAVLGVARSRRGRLKDIREWCAEPSH